MMVRAFATSFVAKIHRLIMSSAVHHSASSKLTWSVLRVHSIPRVVRNLFHGEEKQPDTAQINHGDSRFLNCMIWDKSNLSKTSQGALVNVWSSSFV